MTIGVESFPVTLNFEDFLTLFPEFSNITPGMANGYFIRATFLCDPNGTASSADTPYMTTMLLYLLTAHIAWLSAPRDGNGNPSSSGTVAPPTVGRVNSAGEGSVNVGLDMGDANEGSPSQAYYMQTRYGVEYWSMTAGYRTGGFVARPRTPVAGDQLYGVPGWLRRW
jgi:hypothetical protein